MTQFICWICTLSMIPNSKAISPSCGSKREPPLSAAKATSFIIQTPHGLEHVAAEEIRKNFPSLIESISALANTNGILKVNVTAPPTPALADAIGRLACADVSAVYCGDFSSLSMDNSAIDALKIAADSIDWEMLWGRVYLPLHQHQEQNQEQNEEEQQQSRTRPTFRCTCSRTIQMSDWGYNSIGNAPLDSAHVSRIFSRSSDAATSQASSHVCCL